MPARNNSLAHDTSKLLTDFGSPANADEKFFRFFAVFDGIGTGTVDVTPSPPLTGRGTG
jgi:hypothetical protein